VSSASYAAMSDRRSRFDRARIRNQPLPITPAIASAGCQLLFAVARDHLATPTAYGRNCGLGFDTVSHHVAGADTAPRGDTPFCRASAHCEIGAHIRSTRIALSLE
jgi:hypothetical protein